MSWSLKNVQLSVHVSRTDAFLVVSSPIRIFSAGFSSVHSHVHGQVMSAEANMCPGPYRMFRSLYISL